MVERIMTYWKVKRVKETEFSNELNHIYIIFEKINIQTNLRSFAQ
jgi:hypothetical protein